MTHQKNEAAYEADMKTLPPFVRAVIEQLRERSNAQADFIAHLLMSLEKSGALSRGQTQEMIRRWYRSYDPVPGFDEHVQIAEEVERVLDGLRSLE